MSTRGKCYETSLVNVQRSIDTIQPILHHQYCCKYVAIAKIVKTDVSWTYGTSFPLIA